MEVSGEFVVGLLTAIVLTAGVIWRFETRIAGVEVRLGERISAVDARISDVETRLGDRISALSDRVSRIEGLLEGYFSQPGKQED